MLKTRKMDDANFLINRFPRFYSLRKIFSDENTNISLEIKNHYNNTYNKLYDLKYSFPNPFQHPAEFPKSSCIADSMNTIYEPFEQREILV